jgi:glycosyltransferase involved in cell wall biosynthesis
MEVLFISHKHPPSIGGIQAQNKALVDGVARHAPVHRLIWDQREPLVRFLASVPLRAARLLREEPGIGAIHLCDGLMGACAAPIKLFTDVPVVLTVHGLDVVIPIEAYRRHVVERFNAFDAIVAVSRETARACVERGIDAGKLHVITNGIDPRFARALPDPEFRPRLETRLGVTLHEKRVLVHIGRAVRRKGLSWFLNEVLPQLDPDVVFLMVGPRDARGTARLERALGCLPRARAEQLTQLFAWSLDEPAIARALARPELRGRAFELGALSFEEMVQTLLLADLFVMPNIPVRGDAEGFGLVALEAATAGLPVLAAGIEGLNDAIVDGENGMLLKPADSALWAHELRRLLDQPELLAERGERAQRYTLAHDSCEQMVARYLALFARLSARSRRAQGAAPVAAPAQRHIDKHESESTREPRPNRALTDHSGDRQRHQRRRERPKHHPRGSPRAPREVERAGDTLHLVQLHDVHSAHGDADAQRRTVQTEHRHQRKEQPQLQDQREQGVEQHPARLAVAAHDHSGETRAAAQEQKASE